ncbi:MAG: HIT domain-containing protein [Planctomycetaceae bacterium]|jgi:ATP adenylyltransferase|nr:HIT domain-containing protein [Planctomycetaceae bacterium]
MNDVLWAPWRLAYVVDDDTDKVADVASSVSVLPDGDADCFLCQAVADSRNKARLVIDRTEQTIAVLNKFPYNNGHLLITPKRHISRLDLLTSDERSELFERITFWVSRLESSLHPDGFNVGLNLGQAAGAGLPGHLHWHIVPRWSGDVNYMTSVASTKVIPQALEALWELISVVRE